MIILAILAILQWVFFAFLAFVSDGDVSPIRVFLLGSISNSFAILGAINIFHYFN